MVFACNLFVSNGLVLLGMTERGGIGRLAYLAETSGECYSLGQAGAGVQRWYFGGTLISPVPNFYCMLCV